MADNKAKEIISGLISTGVSKLLSNLGAGDPKGKSKRPNEPYGHFNFRIEIEGIDCGAFKSVEGLGATVEEIEYQDGMDLYPLKTPGRRKFNNIKLSKGYVASDILWNWFQKTLDGNLERKSGSIVLLDDAANEVLRYNFYNAWPKAWNGFRMDGKGNEILIEDVELVVEYLEIKK
jgi:phage tail-like protein